MSAGVLAWIAVVAGSLLWVLEAASRAWASPPRARARRREKRWRLERVVYVAGYFLVLLGLFGLLVTRGWWAFALSVVVWLAALAFIGLVHRRRARRWASQR